MRRFFVVAALVLVLAVIAFAWWRRHAPQLSTGAQTGAESSGARADSFAAPSSIKSQAALEDDIRQNGVTPGKATLLFALAIAPLPGVTIPAGFVRDPTDFDGTPAVEALPGVGLPHT